MKAKEPGKDRIRKTAKDKDGQQRMRKDTHTSST
jgi:hypothetical protein